MPLREAANPMRSHRLALGVDPTNGSEHRHGLLIRHPQHVTQGQRACLGGEEEALTVGLGNIFMLNIIF